MLAAKPNLRVFLVDPHNEYARSFREKAQVLNPKNLKLPFWLFNFEETVDVFFRGRPGLEEEVEILAQVIPLAKAQFSQRPRRRRAHAAQDRSDRARPSRSTRRCPTGSPISSA